MRSLPVFLAAAAATLSVCGQSVEVAGVYKSIIHQQTGPTTTAPVAAVATAFMEGGVTPSFPAGPRTLAIPGQPARNFVFDEGSWVVSEDFATAAAMDSSFPEGVYTITAGNGSVAVNLTGKSYPAPPLGSATAGVWVNGKLRVSAAQALAGFTITSSVSTGNGFATLEIWSDEDNFEMFRTAEQGYSAIQALVPGGGLKLGKTYTVGIAFDNVVASVGASQISPGAIAFAFYSAETEFQIEVVDSLPVTPLPVRVSASITQNTDGTSSLVLLWNSAVSHRYIVETSSDLETWNTIGRITTAAVGENSRTLALSGSGRVFYQLRAVE